MKPNILFIFLFCLLSLTLQAQIDSRKKSISIPVVESEKKSTAISPLTPSKPTNTASIGINKPNIAPKLGLPKKEFSMFPEEEFGNPGELYAKKLDKLEKDLLPEGHGLYSGLKEDAYWGDYRTKSDYIDIGYRDHGRIDGDLLRILVDDDVVRSNVSLTGGFQGFRLKLNEGLNKIEFYAVNEGSLIPNTAQYRILDQWNNVISGKIWALSEGVKVTIIIVKE
jgi:hypothetical protein